MKTRITLSFSLLVGLMDALTGLLLVLSPAWTLRLMGVEEIYTDTILVSFIGTFVFAVGMLYVFGAVQAIVGRAFGFLRGIWIATSWIRFCICVFGVLAIGSKALAVSWWPVPLTDGLVALFQAGWIMLGKFPEPVVRK